MKGIKLAGNLRGKRIDRRLNSVYFIAMKTFEELVAEEHNRRAQAESKKAVIIFGPLGPKTVEQVCGQIRRGERNQVSSCLKGGLGVPQSNVQS